MEIITFALGGYLFTTKPIPDHALEKFEKELKEKGIEYHREDSMALFPSETS